MDQTVFAVPSGTSVQVGDPIHIMGRPEEGAPTATNMAEMLETNTYEVLVGIRARIPRVYMRGAEIVAEKCVETPPWEAGSTGL